MRFIIIAVCSVVLFFPTFWLFQAVVGPNWGAGIAAVAMYIALPVLAMKVWPGRRVPTTTMLAALEDGSLASADYDVTEVVEVEESEDEGLHFLMDIGQGRALFPVDIAAIPAVDLCTRVAPLRITDGAGAPTLLSGPVSV